MREPIPATRHLAVFETLKEAWHLTKGSKWAILAPLLALVGFVIAGGLLFTLLTHLIQSKAFVVSAAVILIVGLVILMAGFFSGALKITIERARGNSVSANSGFHSFSRVLPVLLTLILLGIIIEQLERNGTHYFGRGASLQYHSIGFFVFGDALSD
jgi:uncharacterized membrane protein